MATSGAGAWFPRLNEIMDEALETGAGIDPVSANVRHIQSALRSYNLCLLALESEGLLMSREDTETYFVPAGTPAFFTDPDTLAVTQVMRRERGTDFQLTQRTYSEWARISQKGQKGTPNLFALHFGVPRDLHQFIVNKDGSLIGIEGNYEAGYGTTRFSQAPFSADFKEARDYDPSDHGPLMILHPVPDKDTEIVYLRLRMSQKANALNEHADLRRIFTDAVISDVAARLALKFNAEKYPLLRGIADKALELARMENRSRSDFVIGHRAFDTKFRSGRHVRRRR